ncbi:MAG TPA: hypothetical protein VLK65_21365 [Vicinamibacteria bacterium]|nr:hypothetical protein [Vicinamibacteria bacterium]
MAILVLVIATPATAAERFELGLFGGWSLPTLKVTHSPQAGNPFADELDQGFLVGARLGYRIRPRLVVEGGYRYSPNGRFAVTFEDRFLGPVELEIPFDRGSHAFFGNMRFELGEKTRIRPFFNGGVGYERFGEGESSLRWSVGGGTIVPLRTGLELRLDAEYLVWPDFLSSGSTAHGVEVLAGLVIGL